MGAVCDCKLAAALQGGGQPERYNSGTDMATAIHRQNLERHLDTFHDPIQLRRIRRRSLQPPDATLPLLDQRPLPRRRNIRNPRLSSRQDLHQRQHRRSLFPTSNYQPQHRSHHVHRHQRPRRLRLSNRLPSPRQHSCILPKQSIHATRPTLRLRHPILYPLQFIPPPPIPPLRKQQLRRQRTTSILAQPPIKPNSHIPKNARICRNYK